MRSLIRRKLEMAARVREFTRAHISAEPGYGPALVRLDERLTRAQAIDARQQEGFKAVKGGRARRQELRRVIHSQVARYLVALGSLATRDQADIASRFRIPDTGLPNAAFVTAVKGLLGDATGQKDKLVELGMSATLLDDLTTMINDFEASAESVRTARRDHIGAREDLEAIGIDLMELVKLIGGITGYRFGDDRDVMAEWKAARQIPRQPRKSDQPAPSVDVRPAA
ncbi:MAG: hypothetical protein ABI836_08525 [Gemmatimonadota bacterium]